MSNTGGVELLGDKQLKKLLKDLPDKVQKKVMKAAMRKAVKPIQAAAQAKAPVDTGTLALSMGNKIKSYNDSKVTVGIVGPKTGFSSESNGVRKVPAWYAHLVEKGHIARDGTRVPPQPFMAPAAESQEPAALAAMQGTLADGIVKEAKKLGNL